MDFEIAINGLFEEPAAEAFTNAPNLETVMKCELGVLRTQPLISLGNQSGVQGVNASQSLLMFAVNKTPPRRRECGGPGAPTPRAFSSMQ